MTDQASAEVTVLIVEDDYLIAESLRGFIEGMGHAIAGPVASVRDALDRLDGRVSVALVDINLGGEPITPLVTALREADIPFAFLSAYANAGRIGADLNDVPFFPKPVSRAVAIKAVTLLLSL
ncbi:MAG: hypothetical protein RQ745_03750 [Longimicrobiales bacterium]|nr:hypothetical protein [Longimicrobiales bacterium]